MADDSDESMSMEDASFEGEWSAQAMTMSDSVLVELGMSVADDAGEWDLIFDHLDEPVPASGVDVDGNSATATFRYPSALRDDVLVTLSVIMNVDGDEMTGTFTADYDDGNRLEGRIMATR